MQSGRAGFRAQAQEPTQESREQDPEGQEGKILRLQGRFIKIYHWVGVGVGMVDLLTLWVNLLMGYPDPTLECLFES